METQEYHIEIISSTETYKVRHPILRTGKPLETCAFDGDDLETTFHFGIYIKNELVGICSFFKNSLDTIYEKNQYQLRGMAVLEEFQGLGFGHIILNHGESFLKDKKVSVIWCNARVGAINFYKKNSYQIKGDAFHIKDIGLHYVMYKTLIL